MAEKGEKLGSPGGKNTTKSGLSPERSVGGGPGLGGFKKVTCYPAPELPFRGGFLDCNDIGERLQLSSWGEIWWKTLSALGPARTCQPWWQLRSVCGMTFKTMLGIGYTRLLGGTPTYFSPALHPG